MHELKQKEKELLQKKKFEKEQLRKKKQIEDYKRKKLEAEEMLANADIDFDEVEDQGQYGNLAGNNNKLLGSHNATYKQADTKQAYDDEIDDEDRYLDDIINRNYQKAPPAVV